MDIGGDSSSKNQCYHGVVLSQNVVPQGQGPPKTHLIPKASATMALANLATSGAIVEDEVGTNFEE